MDTTCDREFWQRHPGLVWSNPSAGDSAFFREQRDQLEVQLAAEAARPKLPAP